MYKCFCFLAGLGEFRIRDLNDEINKLLREKGHWEVRIKELGGPDYGVSKQQRQWLLGRSFGSFWAGWVGPVKEPVAPSPCLPKSRH